MSESLCEDHELQVQSYLRFARMKRDNHLKEVSGVIQDLRDYRVEETVYTKPDVESMLESLQDEIGHNVEKELAFIAHSNALLLRLLFKQAEDENVILSVDTNALENELLINTMKALEESALSKPASAFMKKATKLGKISTAGGTDPKVIMERDQLKEEVARLRNRYSELQFSTNSMMKEKSAMAEELARLKSSASTQAGELESSMQDRQAHLQEKEKEMAELRAQLQNTMRETEREKSEITASSSEAEAKLTKKVSKLKKELQIKADELRAALERVENADAAMNGKLNQSNQFLTMKKMMMAKSQQVTELRKRLAMYEPPDEDIADGDA